MMGLPEPTLSFTIPSLHDGKLLACRIYHPKRANGVGPSGSSKRAAIMAHPYAPMGGSYDDPIVGIVGNEILKQGWTVLTFNFRGAGESQGRTSWTSNAECVDYASVAGFLIRYVALLRPRAEVSEVQQHVGAMDLIIGGYSYGSMIANHLPPIPAILAPFGSTSLSDASREMVLRAEHLAGQTNEEQQKKGHLVVDNSGDTPRKSSDHTLSVGGSENATLEPRDVKEHGNIRHSIGSVSRKLHLRKSSDVVAQTKNTSSTFESERAIHFNFPINTHYLLVSPLLPPIASLIALPFSSPSNDVEHMQKLATNATLAIYGEEDGFTSSKKLNAWCRDLTKVNPRFQGVEVDCAGHFWREPGVAQELVETVGNWVSKLVDHDTKL